MYSKQQKAWQWPVNEAIAHVYETHPTTELNQELTKYMPRSRGCLYEELIPGKEGEGDCLKGVNFRSLRY